MFLVEITDGASIGALKKAITSAQQYTCPACELKLFVARKANCVWLSTDDALGEELKKYKTTAVIKTLMEQECVQPLALTRI